jgi:hypothetical protein
MKSVLPTYNETYPGDMYLRGMHRNFNTGIVEWRDVNLPLFWSDPFPAKSPAPTIAAVSIRKLYLHAGERTVVSEQSLALDTVQLVTISGGSYSRWQSDTNKNLPTSLKAGYYEIAFSDNFGREMRTAPFIYNPPAAGSFPVISFQTNSPGGQLVASFETNNSV